MSCTRRRRSAAGDRSIALMNSRHTEAPDYPTRTSGHSQLDLDRFHAKAFWNEGNCVEQAIRNHEPCPRVARSSLLFLSVKVKDVHFGLPTGIDTPAKSDCEQLQPLRGPVFNEDQRYFYLERSTFFIEACPSVLHALRHARGVMFFHHSTKS